MASTVPITLIEVDNGDGTTTPLPGVTVKVWDVEADANVGSSTTDSFGYFVGMSVSAAVGKPFRLRVENYHGKAGYFEVLSI